LKLNKLTCSILGISSDLFLELILDAITLKPTKSKLS
jgi:hypothetical protein